MGMGESGKWSGTAHSYSSSYANIHTFNIPVNPYQKMRGPYANVLNPLSTCGWVL